MSSVPLVIQYFREFVVEVEVRKLVEWFYLLVVGHFDQIGGALCRIR